MDLTAVSRCMAGNTINVFTCTKRFRLKSSRNGASRDRPVLGEKAIPFGPRRIIQDGIVVDHQAVAGGILSAEAMDGDAGQHA